MFIQDHIIIIGMASQTMDTQPHRSTIMPLLDPSYPPLYQELFMQVKIKVEKEQYTRELNDLIEKLLVFGQSNYTCWIAKKKIVMAGQISIEDEDLYSQQLLIDNLKNFQLWDYRNFIFQTTKNYERQYQIMDKILDESPKNYHLWSNRIKVVDYAKNYNDQIDRTLKYIMKDQYNNSAWAYRFYCFDKVLKTPQQIRSEIIWALEQTKKHIDNESVWNYVRGFFPSHKLKGFSQTNTQVKKQFQFQFDDYPEVEELCREIMKNQQHITHQCIQTLLTLSIINSQSSERKEFAIENLKALIELQPFRKNYYNWIIENL